MELTITKEKVLEAASKCSQAKDILQTLFPDVFKEEIKADLFRFRDNVRVKINKR